jgi:hypothetical protein
MACWTCSRRWKKPRLKTAFRSTGAARPNAGGFFHGGDHRRRAEDDVNDLPPDAELVKAFRADRKLLLVVVTLDLAAKVLAMAKRAKGTMP